MANPIKSLNHNIPMPLPFLSYYQGFDDTGDHIVHGIVSILSIDTELYSAYNWMSTYEFKRNEPGTRGVTIEEPFIVNKNYIARDKFISIRGDINHNFGYYIRYPKEYDPENDIAGNYLYDEQLGDGRYFPEVLLDNKAPLLCVEFLEHGFTQTGKTIFKLRISSDQQISWLLSSIYDTKWYPSISGFSLKEDRSARLKFVYDSIGALYENISGDGVSSYGTQLCSILRLMKWGERVAEEYKTQM